MTSFQEKKWAEQALFAQDACNLVALAGAFHKLCLELNNSGTGGEKLWKHPAVRLFVNKFESLCHSEANFVEAYDACHNLANSVKG